MNYIITNNKKFFESIGEYNYCSLEDMILPKSLAIDTETTGLDVYYNNGEFIGADIFSIQIGTGENNYLIDCQTHNKGFKVEQIIPYLQDKILVFHNSTFDLKFFYRHGFFPKKVYDTFIASKILYNGGKDNVFTHSFGAVMERELGIVYDKSEQQNIANIQLRTDKAIQYCFNDVDKLLDLGRFMYQKIKKDNITESYELNCNFTRALAYMEMCGLPVSEEKWKNKIIQNEKELEETEEEINNYIYEKLPKYRDTQIDLFDTEAKNLLLNLDSPKQMIPVFKDFSVNVINKEGKESIKEDVISRSEHEFVKLWLKYQGINQNLSTFGQNILDKVINGRIYTSFNPMVDTCRISSKKGGINFLNFPADSITRDCFEAKKGFKMVVCDYEGQENVVGADLHNDPVMVASINEGKDLHCAFARMLYPEIAELSDEEITKNHKDKRTFAKSPRFAFAYGGNGFTISMNLNIPLSKGQEIEDKFKELHSGIYTWGDKKYEESIKQGFIASGGGFRLYLPNFQEFKTQQKWIESLDKEYWGQYRDGKNQRQKLTQNRKDLREGKSVDEYMIENPFTYEIYMKDKDKVSSFFKGKSKYYRLCLNSPIQSISAHQTKSALVALFDQIIDNGDIWKVLICNSPYDEVVLEVKNNLCEKYKDILGKTMREEGDKWLHSGIVKMGATANIGKSWDEAK